MGTTPLNSLPYPEATDTPYVHLDIKALADAVAAKLYVECTSGARPAHRPGRRIYETDTARTYISNGTTWVPFLDAPAVTPMPMVSGWIVLSSITGERTNGRVLWTGRIARDGLATIPAGLTANIAFLGEGWRPPTPPSSIPSVIGATGAGSGYIAGSGAGSEHAPRASLVFSPAGNVSLLAETALTSCEFTVGYRL